MKKLVLKRSACLCAALIFAYSHGALAQVNQNNETNDELESIEIVGHINSFLNQSELELNQASAPDMRKQLQALPGVNVNGNGLVSGVIQYRGLFGDRVRVNVDGNEIAGAGPNAMDSPLSHLVGSAYQSITLHQGIAPVSVGAETIGGAIEIETRPYEPNTSAAWRTEGLLSGSYFDNDGQALSAVGFSSANNRYIGLSADWQKGSNYTDANGIEIPSTFYERAALKLNTGLVNGKHRIDFTLAKRDTNESGTPALAMDIIFVDALWYRLKHRYEASHAWQINTQVYGNQNQHDMNNFALRQSPMPAMFRLNDVESEAAGIESSALYENNEHSVEFGAEVFKREHESIITNPNNAMFFLNNFIGVERGLSSVFAEYTQESQRIHWQTGLRYSQVNANADPVSTNMAIMNPNAAALQNAFNQNNRDLDFDLYDIVAKVKLASTENLSFVVSAALKERAPSYNELYTWFPLGVSAGLADGRNYIGNLDLNKESAKKVDLGLQYQANKVSLIANIFYSDIDDYILGSPSNNQAANNIAMMNNIMSPLQWNNTDARLSGAEMRVAAQLSDAWQVIASTEYVRAKQRSPIEQDLYRIAPLSALFQVSYSKGDLQWHTQGRFVAAQNKVAEQQNEAPTGGYAVFDTRLVYNLNRQIELSLLIENLLDKAYAEHLAGINRVNNSELAIGSKVPGAGRNVGVVLQYQF